MSAYGTCPHCGYTPEAKTARFAEFDLVICTRCHGRSDVVRENGILIFVESTETFGLIESKAKKKSIKKGCC